MNKNITIVLTALMLIAFAYFNQQIGKQQMLSQQREAYAMCVTAHSEDSGASEEACGNAQDLTSTEFVCNNVGRYCWLEVK